MEAGDEMAAFAQEFPHFLGHARHDVHANHYVGRVGQLDPDVRDVRTERPMENGTTYRVRPRIQPSKSLPKVAHISPGSTQLFVGPASSSRSEQMKVRSSVRATSLGSESARKEFGRSLELSRFSIPDLTISSQSRSYSSCEPSHH